MGNILAIRPAGRMDVYNMTVEKHHNFLINGNIIVKNCDALRYGLVFRTMGATLEPIKYEEEEDIEDYDDFMTGGEVTASYMSYGG